MTRIATCPMRVKSDEVSRTVSPVTQTALVAVKSASIGDILAEVVDCGRRIIKVPTSIARMKPDSMNLAGFVL